MCFNMISNQEKITAIGSYLLLRKEAINRINENRYLGNLKKFAFSIDIFDIQLMQYKENYIKNIKEYTMRHRITDNILVYEKNKY